ncbi:hypothetical protein ACP4OV_019386 [Aristida adscensionis]
MEGHRRDATGAGGESSPMGREALHLNSQAAAAAHHQLLHSAPGNGGPASGNGGLPPLRARGFAARKNPFRDGGGRAASLLFAGARGGPRCGTTAAAAEAPPAANDFHGSSSSRVNLAEEEDGDDVDGAQGQRNLQARASASSSDEHSSSDEDETVDMISTRGRKIQQSIILNHQRMNLQFTTIMATMMVCMTLRCRKLGGENPQRLHGSG